jgi:acetyltransferase AlgX (SGNH hydrolase-like protein)
MSGDVHVGRDGWLFLAKGSNEVLRFFTEPGFLTQAESNAWVDILRARRDRLAAMGIAYRHAFVPDKLAIYPEFFDGELPNLGRQPSAAIAEAATAAGLGDVLLDLAGPMRAAKGQAPMYLKTDSHWTFEGCMVAYRTICRSLGVPPREGLMDRPFSEMEIALDLGGKFDPPIREKARFRSLLHHARRVSANPLVQEIERLRFRDSAGLLSASSVVFENRSPSCHDARVVLFGDSYSEFRPHALTGLLAETFRETHFHWSASVDFGYVERVRPDIVLSEVAERFVKRLPDDGRDLERVAAERLADHRRRRAALAA